MRSGPNIVDLAIALAVISALTGIAIPMFFSRPRVTLDHASILLASDLRYAQNEAALSGESTTFVLDETGDGYSVYYKSGRPVSNPVGRLDLVREYSLDAVFRGVSLELIEGNVPIRFDRYGFAMEPARIELRYMGDTRTLEMKGGSGLVEITGLETDWVDDGL